MKLLRIVPLVFLVLVGCGKAKEKSAGEKLLDEMETGVDTFCKCGKDEKCLEEATKKGEDLDARWKKEFPDESKIPTDLKTRFDAATKKVMACAANEPPPADPKPEGVTPEAQLLLDLADVQTKVCACTDKACVEKELDAAKATFDDRFKAVYGDESKIPADVNTKVDEIKKAVEDCAGKIGSGEAPPAPPAAGRSPEVEKAMADFHALKDEICACADAACANASMEKGEGLEDKLKAALGTNDIPQDIDDELKKIEKDATECAGKFEQ